MLKWLLQRFRSAPTPTLPVDLPTVSRQEIEHVWHRPGGMPRVDWLLANAWIQRKRDASSPEAWRRAVMAACLDEVRDTLETDHRRWRSRNVEGLAPCDSRIGKRVTDVAEEAYVVLRRDLQKIRGEHEIPPIAIALIAPTSAYIDFTDSYFPDEGEFATSGGLYLNEGDDAIALIAVNASTTHALAQTIVHELTHHALRGSRLPLWAEEGLTQMMEERVTRVPNFELSRTMQARQQQRWDESTIDEFIGGAAFSSPEDDTQELAYHLAQWIVRGELTRRPDDFFRFLRDCRDRPANVACKLALGAPPAEVVLSALHDHN